MASDCSNALSLVQLIYPSPTLSLAKTSICFYILSIINSYIHLSISFSILSDNRFKASSKTIPPHSAI